MQATDRILYTEYQTTWTQFACKTASTPTRTSVAVGERDTSGSFRGEDAWARDAARVHAHRAVRPDWTILALVEGGCQLLSVLAGGYNNVTNDQQAQTQRVSSQALMNTKVHFVPWSVEILAENLLVPLLQMAIREVQVPTEENGSTPLAGAHAPHLCTA